MHFFRHSCASWCFSTLLGEAACLDFVTENSSFWITVSSDSCDWDTGLELPHSCSPSFSKLTKGGRSEELHWVKFWKLQKSDVSFHFIENPPVGTHLSIYTYMKIKENKLLVAQIYMSVTSIKKPECFLLSKLFSAISFNILPGPQTAHMGLSRPVGHRTTGGYSMIHCPGQN